MIEGKFNLNGKLAVVTGGAGFLGIQHCEALVEAGAEVVILDVDDNALLESIKHFKDKFNRDITALNTDITSEKRLCETKQIIFDKYSKYPEILINNAAIDPKFEKDSDFPVSRLENFNVMQWDMELAVGLTGAMLCTKHFGKSMADEGRGVILNISSDLGLIAPDQRLYRDEELSDEKQNVKPVTYSVIKHGLIGLTRYTATYWADKGVRCNALTPGGMFRNHDEKFLNRLEPLIPMGRMAEQDEYKGAVLFLCSNASSYINGAVLAADGGRSTW